MLPVINNINIVQFNAKDSSTYGMLHARRETGWTHCSAPDSAAHSSAMIARSFLNQSQTYLHAHNQVSRTEGTGGSSATMIPIAIPTPLTFPPPAWTATCEQV